MAILSAIGVLMACHYQVNGASDTCLFVSAAFDLLGFSISRVWTGGLVTAASIVLLLGFSIHTGTPPVDRFFSRSLIYLLRLVAQ